jgi:hypothetical protein
MAKTAAFGVSQLGGGRNCGGHAVYPAWGLVFPVLHKQGIHLVIGHIRAPKSAFFSHFGSFSLTAYRAQEQQLSASKP